MFSAPWFHPMRRRHGAIGDPDTPAKIPFPPRQTRSAHYHTPNNAKALPSAMSYLAPHFGPDVFVSYSHGDPLGRGKSPLKDWTQALIQRLESEIISLKTEFKALNIFRDGKIDPTAHLTAELRGKVDASGILMIVMSEHYLDSSWCHDELEWFRKQIQDRGAGSGRVFVIRAQETDAARWPEFLRDERGHAMPGFRFYDSESGFPWGWPHLQDPGREFEEEFRRLQTAVVVRLRELRVRAAKRSGAEAVPAPAPASGPRRIYLYASPEAEPASADIRLALTGDGIEPLSVKGGGAGLADWQRSIRVRREAAKRCEALALLRADDSEGFDHDLFDIGVDERELIVKERGAPLPCAVLDKSGKSLPLDVAPFGIAHFDVNRADWRGAFRNWLDAARAHSSGAAP
jgi:hypothetical protein